MIIVRVVRWDGGMGERMEWSREKREAAEALEEKVV